MKYNDLDGKQKANYWALTYLLDIMREELGEENPLTTTLVHNISVLETNLDLELYTDCAFLKKGETNV